MSCGYSEKLVLYVYGEAGADLAAEVEAHLAACPACRGEAAALKDAGEFLAASPAEPSPWAQAAVMRAVRETVPFPRRFAFGWREFLLSGALASLAAVVFSVSGRRAAADLAWNSGIDSGLDSVEYSVYQEQADLVSPPRDWDYRFSDLEDETLELDKNV